MRASALALLLVASPFALLGQTVVQTVTERSVQEVLRELSEGFIEGFAEKPVSRLGDAASVALTKIFADQKPSAKDIDNMLVVIRIAFGRPRIVATESDRQPRTTLFVLQYLESLTVDAEPQKRIADTRRFVIEQADIAAVPLPGELDSRIDRADNRKYASIREAADWKSPYLIIEHDGIEVRSEGGRQLVSPQALALTLINLPVSAWPYGRVIAVQETGLRSSKDDGVIKRNLREAEKILRALGLEISFWPSA